MRNKRLMRIYYSLYDKDLVERLDTCLKMCCMPHVIYDDKAFYTIYIDKGNSTWEQVKREVNRVKSVKFHFESGVRIEQHNGKYYVVEDCGTI